MKTKEICREVNVEKLVKVRKKHRLDSMDYALFAKDLERLINIKSLENGSNTPDYILADYLTACLRTFDKVMRSIYNKKLVSDYLITDMTSFLSSCLKNLDQAVQRREKHYGRK